MESFLSQQFKQDLLRSLKKFNSTDLRILFGDIHSWKHCQDERGCFACARLWLGNHILGWVSQEGGEGCLLKKMQRVYVLWAWACSLVKALILPEFLMARWIPFHRHPWVAGVSSWGLRSSWRSIGGSWGPSFGSPGHSCSPPTPSGWPFVGGISRPVPTLSRPFPLQRVSLLPCLLTNPLWLLGGTGMIFRILAQKLDVKAKNSR